MWGHLWWSRLALRGWGPGRLLEPPPRAQDGPTQNDLSQMSRFRHPRPKLSLSSHGKDSSLGFCLSSTVNQVLQEKFPQPLYILEEPMVFMLPVGCFGDWEGS